MRYSARIAAKDRHRLERLVRYCARPPSAAERIEGLGRHRLIYPLEPGPDGRTSLRSGNLPHSRGSPRCQGPAEEDSGTIFLDEERFTDDPLAQPEPSSRIRSARELVSRASVWPSWPKSARHSNICFPNTTIFCCMEPLKMVAHPAARELLN